MDYHKLICQSPTDGPAPAMAVRVACLAAAVLLNGVATALYVGAGLGPGRGTG